MPERNQPYLKTAIMSFPDGSVVKNLPANAGDFTILAWRIPWTEEPGGL